MTLDASEALFELEWTKRKLDGAIQASHLLLQENDILRGMIELAIDQFNHYSMGDLWTQEDMMIVRDMKQQLEDMQ